MDRVMKDTQRRYGDRIVVLPPDEDECPERRTARRSANWGRRGRGVFYAKRYARPFLALDVQRSSSRPTRISRSTNAVLVAGCVVSTVATGSNSRTQANRYSCIPARRSSLPPRRPEWHNWNCSTRADTHCVQTHFRPWLRCCGHAKSRWSQEVLVQHERLAAIVARCAGEQGERPQTPRPM